MKTLHQIIEDAKEEILDTCGADITSAPRIKVIIYIACLEAQKIQIREDVADTLRIVGGGK